MKQVPVFFWLTVYISIFIYTHRVHIKRCHWFFRRNFYKYWRIFVIFCAQLRQSHWRKNFLPHVRYVATVPCESVRHKSNTFHTILALCTCLYRSHLWKPVSMKQTKHSRKSEAQNLCSKCPPFNVQHSNDYTTAKSLPRWCGPAASTPSWDVLSTPSHHGSANSRLSLEGYPRCCSPPDSNLANWVATYLKG